MLKRIVYRLYKRRLLGEVKEGVIPRHLGLIQDGNRRFAQEAGISKLEGYRLAAAKTEEVLSWCSELEIPSVTLWWLSTENLSRHVDDLSAVVEVTRRIEGTTRGPNSADRRIGAAASLHNGSPKER